MPLLPRYSAQLSQLWGHGLSCGSQPAVTALRHQSSAQGSHSALHCGSGCTLARGPSVSSIILSKYQSSASESIFWRQTHGCFLHEGTSLPTTFGSFMDYSSSLLIWFIIERAEQRQKSHSLYISPLLFQPISLKDIITETVNWG